MAVVAKADWVRVVGAIDLLCDTPAARCSWNTGLFRSAAMLDRGGLAEAALAKQSNDTARPSAQPGSMGPWRAAGGRGFRRRSGFSTGRTESWSNPCRSPALAHPSGDGLGRSAFREMMGGWVRYANEWGKGRIGWLWGAIGGQP